MGIKLTEAQFKKMMRDNPNIQIHSSFGDDMNEVTTIENQQKQNRKPAKEQLNALINDNDKKKKKRSSISTTLTNAHESLNNSQVNCIWEKNGLLLVFDGAKILSRNQTDSLKEGKYTILQLSKYKKLWFEKVTFALKQYFLMDKEKHDFFNVPIRLYLYRETNQKLYDEDNLTTGFKYLIDGLRQPVNVNGITQYLIKDDNQTYIKECIPFQVKSEKNMIAIRILKGSNKPDVKSFDEFINLP